MEDREEDQGHQIFVFSIKGDLLYKSGRIEKVQVSWAVGYVSSLNIYWCDDENILYDSLSMLDRNINVHVLNIYTGKENILFSKGDLNPSQAFPLYFPVLKYDAESHNPAKCLYLASNEGQKQYLTCVARTLEGYIFLKAPGLRIILIITSLKARTVMTWGVKDL